MPMIYLGHLFGRRFNGARNTEVVRRKVNELELAKVYSHRGSSIQSTR